MGLIPGQGTKIPHASGQLSPRTTTRQPQQNKAVAKTRKAHAQQREVHVPQWSACTLQLRPSTVKIRGFPCGSAVKNPPAMWETWVRSLGWKDPLEKGMATHSSVLVFWSGEFHGLCSPSGC